MKEILDGIWTASASSIVKEVAPVITGLAIFYSVFTIMVLAFIIYVFIRVVKDRPF